MTWLRVWKPLAKVAGESRAVFGINRRNAELVYPHNQRRDYPLADDKLLCKALLSRAGVPVPENLAHCGSLFGVSNVLARLQGEEHFVVKPAHGSGGDGVLVVRERVVGGWRLSHGQLLTPAQLHRHVAAIVLGAYARGSLDDQAFVEPRLENHVALASLGDVGLCDLRVITLRGEPLLAMLRVPTQQSQGRANLHQGGLGLAVDLESGRVVRAMHRRRLVTSHPDTKKPLLNLSVPAWPEVMGICQQVAGAVPLGYLGIDVAIDRVRGPLVLEINARPGLEIQNVAGIGLGTVLAQRGLL